MTRMVLALIAAVATLSPRAHCEQRLADERIVLHTIAGDIVMYLYPDVAPEHVKQLLNLARRGVFDGTYFYRVDPTFVLQLANAEDRSAPLTAEQQAEIHTLKAEFSNLKHHRGILSMARADGNPDTGSTSFSILLVDAPHLDNQYTIFGHVDKRSMEVVDEILKVRREGTKPKFRIEVMKASVATQSELDQMGVRGPIPLPSSMAPANLRRTLGIPPSSATLLGVMVVVALCSFLFANRKVWLGAHALILFQAVLALALIAGMLSTAFGAHEDDPDGFWENYPAAREVLGGVGCMFFIGVINLICFRKMLGISYTLNLLTILIGAILLFMLFLPLSGNEKWLSPALFIGLLCVIKLMTSFEGSVSN